MKLYGTFDKQIVQQCQYYVGCLPLSATLDIRQTEFLSKLPLIENATNELNEIAKRYDFDSSDVNKFVVNCRNFVHKDFETLVRSIKFSV